MPYDLPNISIENGPTRAHVRIGWLRSVANIYHGFGIQCFTDELAHRAHRDSLEYLLDLIGTDRTLDFTNVQYPNYGADYKTYPWETGRLRHVAELVAEKSGWARKKSVKGHGFGIAAHRSFLTYVATVVEVEVTDQGEIRIPRVDTALDAGLVTNPEITRAQFEGAAVFGTSIVRSGEITAKNGAVQQSNFNDYPVARISEAPRQTNVYIVDSSAPPAGVGEPGVPPFVAALCNAIFAATGKRVRSLPLSSNQLS
jgi:isoquinoline 1-oxidoreductase beta subunit